MRSVGDKIGSLCHFAYKQLSTQCESCPVKRTFEDKKIHFSEETVQTKDERANKVYAIKVRVENDGRYKIGMYGEVNF